MISARQLLQQTDRRIAQLQDRFNAERPPPPSVTVFSSHLASVHGHVRIFRELLQWLLEDASFPFAQHWVRSLVGAEVSDAEAIDMLVHQSRFARGSAAEEAEMRSTNDYTKLEESIVCHLGVMFLQLRARLANDGASAAAAAPDLEQKVPPATVANHEKCTKSDAREEVGAPQAAGHSNDAAIHSTPDEQTKPASAKEERRAATDSDAHLAIAKVVCRPGSAFVTTAQLPPHAALEEVLAHKMRELCRDALPHAKVASRHGAASVQQAQSIAQQRKRIKSASYGANRVLRSIQPPAAPRVGRLSTRDRQPQVRVEVEPAATLQPHSPTTERSARTTVVPLLPAKSLASSCDDGCAALINTHELQTKTGWSLLTELRAAEEGPSRPHTARGPGRPTAGFSGIAAAWGMRQRGPVTSVTRGADDAERKATWNPHDEKRWM